MSSGTTGPLNINVPYADLESLLLYIVGTKGEQNVKALIYRLSLLQVWGDSACRNGDETSVLDL